MENRTQARKNIFVIGFDEAHGKDVSQIPDADRYRFHSLLHAKDIVYQEHYDIDKKLQQAREVLQKFQGTIDGIVCHWDFPATSITALLCEEFNLPGPSLTATLKCSHKYWSRLVQRQVVPDNTPKFCAVDPFADDPLAMVTLEYPFWIKPIKGYGSALGFRINNADDFHIAMAKVRARIRRLGDPFNDILKRVDLPEALRNIDGNFLIAEELMHGRELAPEGSVQNKVCRVHGVIDMVRDKNQKSFQRYEYPSQRPHEVQQRASQVAEKVLKEIGFNNGCFNMEFFWNEQTDDLWIIEINPRISQSHSYQFEMVDGLSNHEVAIHVAIGEEPLFESVAGNYRHAAKFLLREFAQDDAIVKKIPTQSDVERLQESQPDARVDVVVDRNQRLSTLLDQDSYSYLLAEICLAAQSPQELLENYRQAVDCLPFSIKAANKAYYSLFI